MVFEVWRVTGPFSQSLICFGSPVSWGIVLVCEGEQVGCDLALICLLEAGETKGSGLEESR
jgi:hypothetical protein